MNSVFFEKPQFLLFFAAAIIFHAVLYFFKSKQYSLYIALACVALHSAAICVLLQNGASSEDILLFVLFSAFVSLLLMRRGKKNSSESNIDENPAKNLNENGGKNK